MQPKQIAPARGWVRPGLVLAVMSLSGAAVSQSASGQLFTYDFADVTTSTNSSAGGVASNVTFSTFTRSAAVGGNANAAGRFSFTNWGTGATDGSNVFTGAIDLTKYYEVTVTPQHGFKLDLDTITFSLRRSSTGIRQSAIRSNRDSSFGTNLAATASGSNVSIVATNVFQVVDTSTGENPGQTITLGSNHDALTLLTPATFRFYAWNAEATGGTYSLDDVAFAGTVSAAPLYWDLNSTDPGVGGAGPAAWNMTSTRWNLDPTGVAAPGTYVSTSPAVFAGTPGEVDITTTGGGITASGGLRFEVNGYTIRSGGGVLTIGATNTIEVASSGHTATMNNTIGGSNGLTKTGAGVLVLGGTNTYTGTTTVMDGVLLVNGSHSTGTAYTVKTGATLGGTGSIDAPVTVEAGGTLSPGTSVGVLTVVDDLTLSAGSNYKVEIDTTGGTIADGDQDKTNVTGGGVTVTGANLVFVFSPVNLGTVSTASPVVIIQNDGIDPVTGSFAGLPRGGAEDSYDFDNGVLKFTVYYSYDSVGSTTTGGNDIALDIQAVPEPASLSACAAASMLLRRRRGTP